MALKQFKTESKRILDLMANSIYTNTDIFLRELISNASDALDKRYFLFEDDKNEEFKIKIDVNKKDRIITIEDNGIGMNKAELEENLGTIARSGSLEFKDNLDEKEEIDIIGQFGVGFYSSFMVADKIEVLSRKVNEDKAYLWISENEEGYEIKQAKKDDYGTIIKLHIKENNKEKKYDKYLDKDEIQNLIKKYSDFIRYPIEMEVEVTVPSDKEGNVKKVLENKVINSMIPIWKKSKKDIKENDYYEFYQNQFNDYYKPLKVIHYKVEGVTSYTALLYIPSNRPMNYYTNDYKLGLKLYSKGVFIKDEAKELVSDYFRFIKGVVDSDDLNLNISREILQQDYQMNQLKKSIDKKIKTTLLNMLEKQRDEYEKFFDNYGTQLKFGTYDKFGQNKDVLIDLLLFKSTNEDKYVTLKEYVSRMKDDQKEIYYASGETIEQIKNLPQMEKILDKGYEVLYFTESVDEFLVDIIKEFDSKHFKSIQKGELNLESEEEKEAVLKKQEDNKDLIDKIQETLNDKVSEVRLSNRLKSSPVCLVSDDNMSLEMEKILKEMHQGLFKANRILEINPDHDLFKALKKAFDKKENIKEYCELLYDQAALIAGVEIEDPIAFSNRINDLMLKTIK